MAIEGATEPTVNITVDNKNPAEAIEQFETNLAEGKTPVFSEKTAKAVQKYVATKTKQSITKAAKQKTLPDERQIKIGAGVAGQEVLSRILKAKEAGLNVELSPEAKEALAGLVGNDLTSFATARVEVKNDPVSMVRLQQLVALGFMPVLPQEEKKIKALRERLQKMQQKQANPIVIQSGSAHRDWSVFKECTEKLGMAVAFVGETADPHVKEARRQALLAVLAIESNILDLTKYPKEKQIALAQKLAPFGFRCMVSARALKNEPITIASNNIYRALDTYEVALAQGFSPLLDSTTQQLVNQYYFDTKTDFRLVTLHETEPKKLFAQIQSVLSLGFPIQLNERQKVSLRQYIEKEAKKPTLVLQGVNRAVIKHNLQLAQDVGVIADISGLNREHFLPSEPITIKLLQQQKGGGLFSKAKLVPDLEGTIDEATKLAKLGVKMKLSSEMLPLLKEAQAKVRAEDEKNKGKKNPKYSKVGRAAKNILEKFKILDTEMKRTNTPTSFTEFEEKTPDLIQAKAKVVAYQNVQKAPVQEASLAPQAGSVVPAEPEQVDLEKGEVNKTPNAKP